MGGDSFSQTVYLKTKKNPGNSDCVILSSVIKMWKMCSKPTSAVVKPRGAGDANCAWRRMENMAFQWCQQSLKLH